METLRRA